MKKRAILALMFSVLLVVISSSAISLIDADVSLEVLVVGDDIDDAFMQRLELDHQFVITVDTVVGTDLSSYDSVLIFDYVPTAPEISLLNSFAGGIAVFIYGNLAADASLLVSLGLASTSSGSISTSISLPVPRNESLTHPILDKIPWNSVPTITNYTTIQLAGTVLLETSAASDDPNLGLISTNDNNRLIAFNMIPVFDVNPELIEWPYFNYMLYLTLMSINDIDTVAYGKWDYSPVPHTLETVILGVSVALTIIVTVIGIIFSKKYTKKNPLRQQDLKEISKDEKSEKWQQVGMHRQLGGFLVQLFAGLLIILPNAVMSALVFPLLILPSPQAVGFYDFTIKFFEALWLFFDFGTSIVLVKFFSEHRVKRPEKAIRYVQLFVWFQMLSGIAQLFLISFLGSMIFPATFLAHMSWLFVTHAFFQWPAFFLVFMYLFQAMNRIDFFQILNLLLYAVFNITIQYLVIVLFRFTLGKNPIFGDGLAGAIGYSVGFYVIQVMSFLVGLLMFKRLGFSLKTIFRIDFTKEEIKEAWKFGSKWMIGAILPALGWFIQLFLLSRFLPNYTQQQGYFSLAWNFATIVMLVGLFANGFLPAISESYHAKKPALTRYYTVSSLKWSAYFDWYLVAALAAIGWRFIIGGAGTEWEPAAGLIIWFLIFHTIGYFSWLGDWMFAGSDRPGWAAISWVIEQGIRAGLLVICIPNHLWFEQTFGSPMVAIMFAYFPALIIKNIFMWWQIRRNEYFKFKWKDLYWQGIIAPLIAAGILFGILEGLFQLIWQGEIITSVVILLIGTLIGLYLFAFIASFFGAFDDNTLKELKQATEMAGGFKFMAKPLYKMTEWGAKISPLHNKFKMSGFDEAIVEAQQLTDEMKQLVI
ncbi:MAG: lipopolysaccharide biosynthesis protein [Candidatus Heimdallarchaeaceae archaeon]